MRKGAGDDDPDWGKLKKGKGRGKDAEAEAEGFKLKKVTRKAPEEQKVVKAEVEAEERERVGFEFRKRDPREKLDKKTPPKAVDDEVEDPDAAKGAYQRAPKAPGEDDEEAKKLTLGKAKVRTRVMYIIQINKQN